MGVFKNRGTPKSSILIGFSIINHPFWGTPIFGNTPIFGAHICSQSWKTIPNFPTSQLRRIFLEHRVSLERILRTSLGVPRGTSGACKTNVRIFFYGKETEKTTKKSHKKPAPSFEGSISQDFSVCFFLKKQRQLDLCNKQRDMGV